MHIVLFSCVVSASVFAESKTPARIHGNLAFAMKQILPFSSPVAKEPNFYETYFQALDEQMKKQYLQEWDFHERRLRYGGGDFQGEYYALGSMNYEGRSTAEYCVRREFANRVVRQRVQNAMTVYFARNTSFRGMKKTARALAAVKNVSVIHTAAAPGRARQELNFGYDALSDAFRLEYIWGSFAVGLYHGRLMGDLMSGGISRDASVRVSGDLGTNAPKFFLAYRNGDGLLTTEIRQPVSSKILAQVISSSSARTNTAALEVRVTYGVQF